MTRSIEFGIYNMYININIYIYLYLYLLYGICHLNHYILITYSAFLLSKPQFQNHQGISLKLSLQVKT